MQRMVIKRALRCSCAFLIFLAATAQDHEVRDETQTTHCFSTRKVTWLNGNEGRIFMRDDSGGLHHLRLKGVSWHGLDTDNFALNGLNETTMEHIVSSLQMQRFNAIRVPISLDFALSRGSRKAGSTDVCGGEEKASMQLHRLFTRAAAHGLLVMLDLHALHARPTEHSLTSAAAR
jgi:aryl-phospho-beta-D-glucosidase BglC (GH1 family)